MIHVKQHTRIVNGKLVIVHEHQKQGGGLHHEVTHSDDVNDDFEGNYGHHEEEPKHEPNLEFADDDFGGAFDGVDFDKVDEAVDTKPEEKPSSSSNPTVDEMLGIGGQEWNAKGHDRIYFNALHEHLPGVDKASLKGSKVFFDKKDNQFHTKNLDEETGNKLIEAIKKKAKAWGTENVTTMKDSATQQAGSDEPQAGDKGVPWSKLKVGMVFNGDDEFEYEITGLYPDEAEYTSTKDGYVNKGKFSQMKWDASAPFLAFAETKPVATKPHYDPGSTVPFEHLQAGMKFQTEAGTKWEVAGFTDQGEATLNYKSAKSGVEGQVISDVSEWKTKYQPYLLLSGPGDASDPKPAPKFKVGDHVPANEVKVGMVLTGKDTGIHIVITEIDQAAGKIKYNKNGVKKWQTITKWDANQLYKFKSYGENEPEAPAPAQAPAYDPSTWEVNDLDPVPFDKAKPGMVVGGKNGVHQMIVGVDGDTMIAQASDGNLVTYPKSAWDASYTDLKLTGIGPDLWHPSNLKPGLKVGSTKVVNGKLYRLNENHRWELVENETPSQEQVALSELPVYSSAYIGNVLVEKTYGKLFRVYKKNADGKPLSAKAKAALKELDTHGAKSYYIVNDTQEGELAAILGGKVSTKPKAKTEVAKVSIPQSFPFTQIGPQKGSNPGGLYQDAFGKKWYIKFPESEDHAKNELLAAKLYGACGVDAPMLKLVSKDGKVGIASAFKEGLTNDGNALKAGASGAKEGFGVDAWLANWDSAGLSFDNMPVDSEGKAVRIDVGGSLLYRAQGGPKGDAFGSTVSEIDSLRNPSVNAQTAAVFGKMTPEEIDQAVAKVLEVPDDIIKKAVNKFGPGTDAEKDELAKKLIARKNYLAKRFPGAMAIAFPPKPDPSALPVKPDDFPKAPNFNNWNGDGKGLSSKPEVNQQNQEMADTIYAIATAGNLTALKSMTYIPVGESTPTSIANHKSQHIKAMYNQCVCTLDTIADPEASKAAKDWGLDTYDGGDIGDLSAACQSYQFGVTKASVSKEKRLGFWLSIGDIDGGHHLSPKVTHNVTPAEHAIGKASNAKIPPILSSFMAAVKSTGKANDPYRDGAEFDKSGNKCRDVIKAAYECAAEFKEGATIRKFIDFDIEPGMMQQMLDKPAGHVFQNPGSMCCSLKPNWSWSGEAELEIVYAKGAKGLYNIGVGSYDSEGEVTTLPGQRFMIVESKKKGPKGKPWFKLLMLPPDQTYVDTLYQKKAAA